MSCCGQGVIKQKPSEVLKAIQEKQTSPPTQVTIVPTPTIPQAIKEQLIVNQQLLRLKKSG